MMQDLYRRLMEFTGDGVYRYTFDDGRILLANKGYVRILDLDCTPEELTGKYIRDMIIYTEKEGSVRNVLEKKGEIRGFEYHFRTLKGDDRWVIHDSILIVDPVTKERVVEAIVKDITESKKAEEALRKYRLHLEELVEQRTAELVKANEGLQWQIAERKQAEESLRESEERFRATFEQAAVGIAQVGLDGCWLRVNQRLCDIVAYTREELLQCTFQDITHPEDLNTDLTFVHQVLAGEISTYSMQKRYCRKDRSLVWVNLTVGLVRDEAGAPKYFVSVVEDITIRKQAEENLEVAIVDLKRSNQELEQFAYVASHDLQEPLRKVASFTQLLAERYADKLDDDARQFIAYAVDGAHRMQGLINDLLSYSRVGTRGRTFELVDCEGVLGYSLANLEVAIKEGGAVVTHDRLPTVMGDASQLVQLFQNLIGNAIKFRGSAPPCVHISVASQEKEWIFRVRDNGIGIDPQYFDRLFVIFQRLHSKAEYPGTGIGLAVSKKVVERHGGRIWVESEPGKGASFYFSIPER
jgi:PAS domain S-box-containing protein